MIYKSKKSLNENDIYQQLLIPRVGFPLVLAASYINEGLEYYVIKKQGPTLEWLLHRTKQKHLSFKTTVQIGNQLIHRLKTLHSFGFLYLKLQSNSICIGSGNFESRESSVICLNDFSNSSRITQNQGFIDSLERKFNFSIPSFVEFKVRDDFIDLSNLLVYLMTGKIVSTFDLVYSKSDLSAEIEQNFYADKPKRLQEFLHEVFHMKPDEGICYEKLVHILTKALLRRDQTPNEVFEWSRFKV